MSRFFYLQTNYFCWKTVDSWRSTEHRSSCSSSWWSRCWKIHITRCANSRRIGQWEWNGETKHVSTLARSVVRSNVFYFSRNFGFWHQGIYFLVIIFKIIFLLLKAIQYDFYLARQFKILFSDTLISFWFKFKSDKFTLRDFSFFPLSLI